MTTMLSAVDQAVLNDLGLGYTTTAENGHVCLVLEAYPLPAGADRPTTDLLIRLPTGFPDTRPNMFWFADDLRFGDTGTRAQAADHTEAHVGRTWWRWSRHINDGWQPGDDLRTYLRYIDRCISVAAGLVAA